MRAVMYHYVRPSSAEAPHLRYLALDDFRRQLDWVQERYHIPTRADALAGMATDDLDDAVILTFDDGLTDHHRFVLPELQQRGLWGIFYVPAGPHLDREPLDVNKVQVLLGRHGGKAVLDELLEAMDDSVIVSEWVERLRGRTYRYQTNDDATLRVKEMLNFFAEIGARRELVRVLERRFGAPVELTDLYMTEDELRELHGAGMLLGSHAISHRPMSQLSLDEQEHEIRESFALLEEITGGLPARTFCYPYGGDETFTDDTERLLDAAGCAFSFSVEPRTFTAADVRARPHALPRFDCNQLPHGTASTG